METDRLDAVVLAGGINRIPLFPGNAPGYKALLPFAGKPAIQYTLEALHALPAVRRIIVAGPEDKLRKALAESGCNIPCEFVPDGDSPMGSVMNVLPSLKNGSPGRGTTSSALFTTADLPLVTGESVQAFLDACAVTPSSYPASLYLSAVLGRSFTGPFAQSRKGHMFFREGAVYHGNLALIDLVAFDAPGLTNLMKRLYFRRKNPIASALTGGWRIALSYTFGALLLRILSMNEMARMVSRRLGVGIVPVRINYPQIALDVDGPGDYDLVRRELEAHATRP